MCVCVCVCQVTRGCEGDINTACDIVTYWMVTGGSSLVVCLNEIVTFTCMFMYVCMFVCVRTQARVREHPVVYIWMCVSVYMCFITYSV